MLEAAKDSGAAEKRRSAKQPVPTAYVWNNVWGWGREDAAYRLANAGFDVVLCNATNLYFDLACEKDPLERGYYWAGFVGMRAPFDFVPLDVFKNASQTSMGVPLQSETFADRVRLTPAGGVTFLAFKVSCGARICAIRKASNTWRSRDWSRSRSGLGRNRQNGRGSRTLPIVRRLAI